MGIIFEYDGFKSQANKTKHGIDFEEAQALWEDPYQIVLLVRSEPEDRFMVLSKMNGKHWTAIITYRGGRVRFISVRRSRKQEIIYYEEAKIN